MLEPQVSSQVIDSRARNIIIERGSIDQYLENEYRNQTWISFQALLPSDYGALGRCQSEAVAEDGSESEFWMWYSCLCKTFLLPGSKPGICKCKPDFPLGLSQTTYWITLAINIASSFQCIGESGRNYQSRIWTVVKLRFNMEKGWPYHTAELYFSMIILLIFSGSVEVFCDSTCRNADYSVDTNKNKFGMLIGQTGFLLIVHMWFIHNSVHRNVTLSHDDLSRLLHNRWKPNPWLERIWY